MKPYRPSNGSEGEWFTDKFCMNCINCDPNPSGPKQCEILFRSLFYDIGDEKYPTEWIYGEDGKPTCTAHVKWDWGNDGDPDDPDNPKAPIPYNPNQLLLFSEMDEILDGHQVKEKIAS